ncbi:MAG: hypothetical protein ACI312_00200 [Bacilli bacterium]
MKKDSIMELLDLIKKISARNKYYTNIIYLCSLPDSISNKIITVAKITL